jgi:PmbA protein
VKDGIGEKALERTLRKLGQGKIASGKYPMIVDNMNAGRLLSPLISAILGSSIQQKTSFLLDKLSEKVLSDRVTLIDEPHWSGKRGARYFDGEGVKTRRLPVFEEGVLKTYYIDTYHGNKLGMSPTISGPSILTIGMGERGVEGLVSSLAKGILVTGFNGGNTNSSTGNYSFGVEGFLIEGGKLSLPISEMNITGNMLTLWNRLLEIGNDVRESSSWRIPSLMFDDVDFSGL